MLTFLTGTDTDRKRNEITERAKRLMNENKKVLIVVPEQSVFDRERDILFTCGEKTADGLKVTSFTNMCRDVSEKYALTQKPEAFDAAKTVIMSLAVEECSESLQIFRHHHIRASLAEKLISEYEEIKAAGLSAQKLYDVSKALPSGMLKIKTEELARIFFAYDALLGERFNDSSDNIPRVSEFLKTNHIYFDTHIFFDGFRGFTGAQFEFIANLLSGGAKLTVSLNIPAETDRMQADCFAHQLKMRTQLKSIADAHGIRVFTENISDGDILPEFALLKESLYYDESAVFEGETDNITVAVAENKYNECDIAALYIQSLLKSGYRCNEIAVIERGDGYSAPMTSALKKYGIPVFHDDRVPLFAYPLTRLVINAVDIAAHGFDTEKILNYIKTDIAGITPGECSAIEEYVYLWGTDGVGWLSDFKENPSGYGESVTEKTNGSLSEINALRKKIVLPLLRLRDALREKSGEGSCRAVYDLLVDIKAADNFRKYATRLCESGRESDAVSCAGVWDSIIDSLDALYEILGNRTVTPDRFFSLLKIILTSGDIGKIPGGIDQIIIGDAERTRFFAPRVAVVLGANEGVFPAAAVSAGVFSVSEKRELLGFDFSLENLPENKYYQELGVVYETLTLASEKLYVSYSTGTLTDGSAEPSEIISMLGNMFPGHRRIIGAKLMPADMIGSKETAFRECAKTFAEDSEISASLKAYISNDPELAGRYESLQRAAQKTVRNFEDPELAAELFGHDMYLSPSGVEKYNNCPFSYFCSHGMKINKREKAAVNVRINGLLVHSVLENMLKNHKCSELKTLSDDVLKNEISELSKSYINEYMGGLEDKDTEFLRTVARVENDIFEILKRLILEFTDSSFEPVKTELKIDRKGEVKPYVLSLPDGGSLTVGGTVDRVDIMQKDDGVYLRVVDYKTGGKSFRLSDVFAGLNLQMVIYLMCLWDNGGDLFGKITPAGIMYVPANNGGERLRERDADEKKILQQKIKNGRMNGLILDSNEVLLGMDSTGEGRYIDSSIGKNGEIKGKVLSYDGFVRLHKKIDELLVGTAMKLHGGNIDIMPARHKTGNKDACKYCPYNDICLHEKDDGFRDIAEYTHEAAVKMLMKGDNGNE